MYMSFVKEDGMNWEQIVKNTLKHLYFDHRNQKCIQKYMF